MIRNNVVYIVAWIDTKLGWEYVEVKLIISVPNLRTVTNISNDSNISGKRGKRKHSV